MIDVDWINRTRTELGITPAELAAMIGWQRPKMSKLLNKQRNLKAEEAQMIQAALLGAAGDSAPGLAEEPAVFVPQARPVPADVEWLRAVAPDARKPILYQLNRAFAALALVAGDQLVVDTAEAAAATGLFIVNVASEIGEADTQLRRRFSTYFVSTDPADPEPVLHDNDGNRIGCIGRVVLALRKFTP